MEPQHNHEYKMHKIDKSFIGIDFSLHEKSVLRFVFTIVQKS